MDKHLDTVGPKWYNRASLKNKKGKRIKMVNAKGIIQNNKTASDFIRQQRKLNEKYKILGKREEREMIERYARLKLDENGRPKYNEDFECEFEWIGPEKELRCSLALHNLQAVTKISTKHCQDTLDYDNMYAKGLFGLTRAANEFHPFKLITKVVGHRIDESGEKVPVREVKLDESGNYDFTKFNTFAQFWIFKYVMDEFYKKSIVIDNNSVSLNEVLNIHGSDKNGVTLENFLNDNISPDVLPPPTVADEVSANEMSKIYETIHEFMLTTNELSSIEKSVLEETFYKGVTNVKKLSSLLKIPQQQILDSQTSALSKLRDFLSDEYGVESLSDII